MYNKIKHYIKSVDEYFSYPWFDGRHYYGRLLLLVVVFVAVVIATSDRQGNRTEYQGTKVNEVRIDTVQVHDTVVVHDTIVIKEMPFIKTPITQDEIERFE